MDTGSGLDLIGECDVPRNAFLEPADPISLHTANGSVDVTSTAAVPVPELHEYAHPYMLEDLLAVLSVGLRCMEHGYSFTWSAGRRPFFTLPCGKVVPLEVHNNIPYLPASREEPVMAAPPAPAQRYKRKVPRAHPSRVTTVAWSRLVWALLRLLRQASHLHLASRNLRNPRTNACEGRPRASST
jgi:hypothetical protein